ncbi:hypothetical protein PsorP6_004672 [Peronosclerospora sorghi]|uniref:Uncharacterized protein n=1 Tax=Peronosclerospora sorghi TaxID=230839 RepID=A0ACC0VK16_9STRA|nr:hypothetical protein PsorP6_004672 [Peronosclerospora sorghi]
MSIKQSRRRHRPGHDGRICSSRITGWLISTIALLTAVMEPSQALVQQRQVIARCFHWSNSSCAFLPLEPVYFSGLNLRRQTVCKADLSVAVKQIDWESSDGGRGSVDSLCINGVEVLQTPVHPSQAYLIPNYPHCNDMFNIFPPWGNDIIGPGGRKSIISEITSDTLSISIHYSWTGPHNEFPVCSMAGVSFAGYAEINIYLEAQENAGLNLLTGVNALILFWVLFTTILATVCPGWDSDLHTACFGNGKCDCAINDQSPRMDMLLLTAETVPTIFLARNASRPASHALMTAIAIQAYWGRESVSVPRDSILLRDVQPACPVILEIGANGVQIAIFHMEIAKTV